MRIQDLIGRSPLVIPAYGDDIVELRERLVKFGLENVDTVAEKMCGHNLVHFIGYGSSHPGDLAVVNLAVGDEKYKELLQQKDQRKRMPVHIFANAAKVKALKYLLLDYKKFGIDPLELDELGRSVIHALCSFGSSPGEKGADKELAECLELLLSLYPEADRKQQLELADTDGFSPVQLAVANGYTKQIPVKDSKTGEMEDCALTKVFKKYGVDPAAVEMPEDPITFLEADEFERTKLSYNSFAGDNAIVKAELAKDGVDPNEENPYYGGRTALMLALQSARVDNATDILKHKHTIAMLVDVDGTNAFMYAANSGSKDAVDLILNGAEIDGVMTVKFRADHIHDTNYRGYTALHAAAIHNGRPAGRVAMVKHLIVELGMDPEAKDNLGNTPRQLAEQRGFTNIVAAIDDAVLLRKAKLDAEAVKLAEQPGATTPGFTGQAADAAPLLKPEVPPVVPVVADTAEPSAPLAPVVTP